MSDPRSVRLSRRRLMVDGKPVLMLSGEVHYFRLSRADWASRLALLIDAGCDAVATYIPWLVHELPDGSIDLAGRTSAYRDVAGFLDLAAAKGLSVIARPGPFVMAELKNEGLPFSVYQPGVASVGWDAAPAPTRDVDYLAPAYLESVKRWYGEVMPMLASRLAPRGGPVVAVQLDNEVGMLSWVTNTPDLTDAALDDFAVWARDRYGTRPFGLDVEEWRAGVRSPGAGSLALHHELSAFQRDRYARYFAFLRAEAESHGVAGVPFLVNLHGTGEGRGRTFPIGISQLYPSYSGQPAMTSGSDHYLGDLTVENVADLYVMNAFMAAVHDADQPLTSLEFEAGLGDYGEDLSRQVPPSALALKTRLCVAQGNRLLNYYLFAGGHNPLLDVPVGDGNDRIAFTGERHGFTAPVGPEGQLNPSYPVLAETLAELRSYGDLLADMDEEYDDVVLGFVPDHYLTEYCHPADPVRRAMVAELERFRGMGLRDVLARSLLLAGFSFPAVNLQTEVATRVLCLASTPTLAADVQQRLADFVLTGGRLLLTGALPTRTPDGTPCTLLADALALTPGDLVNGTPHYFPSVRAAAWTTATAEVRVGVLQPLTPAESSTVTHETFATDVATGTPVGVEVKAGAGHAAVLTCDYPAHLPFWTALLARLGARPRHTHDATAPGIVITSTATPTGTRLLHALNVSPVDQSLTICHDGKPVVEALELPARSGRILRLGSAE
ncbi:beta-galactosidase [Kribbella sp. CA-253562]|uniref:beta-galactosidase n=1 Tax=Kribbella sp. CA-253562 TaxID=3239942 RepID=UPI003D949C70